VCALCGSFGGARHWADDATDASLRERLVSHILAGCDLSLRRWAGGGYIIARPGGPSDLAPSLASVWAVAERASGTACDPLDPVLVDRLSRVEAGP
jgi:hypothetical protein